MSRSKTSKSGYARIAQAEQDEALYHDDPNDDTEHGATTLSNSDTLQSPLQPSRRALMKAYDSFAPPSQKRRRRQRSNSTVDVKAINARLERWAEEIASKFKLRKIKGKSLDEERLEIHHSVFQAPDDIRPASRETLTARFLEQPPDRITKLQFDDVVESVRVAIELGMQPKMITQGSSGSYFARNSDGKVVGVFKPKDEEPYASRNPKWTKWIHRNLFPFFFGRACLIPNLSYISEAAAYVLDTRLQTNIVPYTDVVYISSISFNHDFWDRRAYYRKRKPLPQKVGSFQVFLKGFKDANIFFKDHPWPDQPGSILRAPSIGRSKRSKPWRDHCRPGAASTDDDNETNNEPGGAETRQRKSFWTDALQLSFREQLEKLVILDYIMRNTDRGLDNWMVSIDEEKQQASIVVEPPKQSGTIAGDGDASEAQAPDDFHKDGSSSSEDLGQRPHVALGAIDNSLSWPWKHPDAWRSFPFGWLFLPVSLIGQPFTQRTREHFLPLLTSKQWWSETQVALRQCFNQDVDFKERMFARQIAVMKGQAWNVVETLKQPGHGPLELTRRARVCVWDDLVDIPVVIPLRASSDDAKRRQADYVAQASRASMDISTAYSEAPAQDSPGPMRVGSPDAEIPSSKQFNMSRETSTDGVGPAPGEDRRLELSPDARRDSPHNITIDMKSARKLQQERPGTQRSRTRVSFEAPRSYRYREDARKRNFSFSAGRQSLDSESDDGDLGYAAARDMEGNRKKVIVERLETIKSKGPFFTWC